MAPPTMAPPISPAATPAATPRCALAGVAASEPAIVATATKAANVFFILGLPCLLGVRPRDRRTTQDTKKFPPLHVNPPAGHRIRSTECIDRGWLRVACCKISVVGQTRTSAGATVTSVLPQ